MLAKHLHCELQLSRRSGRRDSSALVQPTSRFPALFKVVFTRMPRILSVGICAAPGRKYAATNVI